MFGDFEKNGFSWLRRAKKKKSYGLFFSRTRGDNNKTRVDEMKKKKRQGDENVHCHSKSFCCA
jgi:hypothetical protein